MFWRRTKKYRDYEIHPDEIFIDNANISNLDQQQFEGVIEQRIPKRALTIIFIFIALVFAIFTYKLFQLQIIQGNHYARISESNRLNKNPIFAELLWSAFLVTGKLDYLDAATISYRAFLWLLPELPQYMRIQ